MRTDGIGFAVCFTAVFTGIVSLQSCFAKSNTDDKNREIQFRKTVLWTGFLSEGVAVADFNNDGIMDIISGPKWFEGPDWKSHDVYKEEQVFVANRDYSNSMLNFSIDVDQDGWVDYIRVDFPGKEIWWFENPKNSGEYWERHTICLYNGNESPLFVDVDGDGREDIVCGDSGTGEMVWYRAPTKPGEKEWRRYVIGGHDSPGTVVFSHGLGLGDINGDGRNDVMIKSGWWEAPENVFQSPWKFHEANLGDDCAQMYVMDVNGDGLADVISSSAHRFGIWWHEQGVDNAGNPTWTTHDIESAKGFSQNHSLYMADINGDGYPDLVSGMRYFAHMGRDPGEQNDPVIFWLEFVPGNQPTWVPHIMDNDSGAGLNTVVIDVNGDGLLDIVAANKKGIFYFEQHAAK